jgi:hypothetical protein
VITDTSGNGNSGLLDGPDRVEGRRGSALHFAGQSDRVTAPSSASLTSDEVSVATYVRASSSPGSWRVFVFKGVDDCAASSWSLKSSGSGGLVFGVYDGTSGEVQSPDAGTGVWDGDWHMVVGTYDREQVRLYVDGELIGGTPLTTAIDHDMPDGDDLVAGHPVNNCSQGTQFTGDLDEVRVWGRALSGSEVIGLQYRPDAAIALTAAGPFKGTFIVSAAAVPAQTVTRTGVKRGRVYDTVVRLRNDADFPDVLRVQGTSRGSTSMSVRYLVNGRNRTNAVATGTFMTGTLAPGETVAVTIRVTVSATSPSTAKKTVLVRATSNVSSASTDVVRSVTTRAR